MPFWSTNSTALSNEVVYVNNTYKDANGNNKLSTITSTNTTGYRDVVEGSTQRIGDNPPGLKGLSYAIDNKGKITYKYDDQQGNIKQYNSIQEFANVQIDGYNAATTARIKDAMQRNLKENVEAYNKTNPTSKVGPAVGSNTGIGDTSTPFDPEAFSKNIQATKGTRDNFKQNGVLTYPIDIAGTKQDVIKFDMLKYKPKKFDTENFGVSARERNFDSESIGTVVLPIPSGISDNNAANWNDAIMDAKDAELANVALSGITGGGDSGADAVKSTAEKIASKSGEVKTAVAAVFADSAVGTRGLLTRTTGAIVNPNLELLFNAPTLRSFSFTFKMSARSAPEAKTIISILRFFKQGMSPQRSDSNLFLKSPHTFKIRYLHRGREGEEHKYIGKIKECALQSFVVNYTPEGQYATFYDGVLVSYEIQMTFQELEPIFNDDYGKNDFNDIGF